MIGHKTFKRLIVIFSSLLIVILLRQIVWGISGPSAESNDSLDNQLPISNQPLQFGGSLSADVIELGEIVTLSLAVRNNQAIAPTPKLAIELPPSLQLETNGLDGGLDSSLLFNSQDQMLYWYPELDQNNNSATQDVSLIALRPTENVAGADMIRLSVSESLTDSPYQLDLPIWVGRSLKPVALFDVSDQEAGVGQKIRFTNRSTGQPPLTFYWDFGDGQTATAAEPIHTYGSPGDYSVTLRVSGKQGEESQTLPVQVGNAPKVELIVQEQIEAGSPLVAQAFSDSDHSVMSWDMGDGAHLDGFWVEHVYATAGEYLLTVNITNRFGNTVLSKAVSVLPAANLPVLSNNRPLNKQAAPINTTAIEVIASPTPNFLDMDIDIQLEARPDLDGLILTDQLLGYINAAREMVGLYPLKRSHQLSLAAQTHTDEAAFGYVNVHIGADGSTPYDRVTKTNYVEGFLVGESTAWGFNSARAAVQFWIDSPDHRPLLFNHEADQVGVGQSTNYDTTYAWYWTAEFASYEIPTSALSYYGPAPILPATITPVPTATPTAVSIATLTPTPFISPTATAPVVATATQMATLLPTGVPTGRPEMTPTPSPSATVALTPTEASPATLLPTVTVTATETEQETSTPTLIAEPTAGEEQTAVPETLTPTQLPAESPTPTPESTESAEAVQPASASPLGETL